MKYGSTRTRKNAPTGKPTERAAGILMALAVFLSAFFIFPARISADEDAELKPVRVAVENSHIFFTSCGKNGQYSGYGYEYIQSIASYVNWDVEYLPCATFSECLEAVRNGEADLFYDVSYTPERTEWLLYPDSPMGTEEYYLFCPADSTDIRSDDLTTFSGKRAGVTAGTIEMEELQQWCAENGVELDIIEYPSDPEKDAAFAAEEIDLEYEISMLAKSDYSALTKVAASDYYLVANIGRSDLIRDINTAHQKIESVDRYFIEHLNEKYFTRSVLNRTLSVDEAEWVSEHDVLRIGYLDNYLPFSDRAVNGEPNGIVRDIVPLMLESIGLKDEFIIEYLSYADSGAMYSALERGEIDTVFPMYENIEFGNSKGLLITSEVISLSADLAYSGSYTKESTARIAVNRSNLMQDYYTRTNYPNAEIVYCDSIEDCLRAVDSGEAGSTILNALRTSDLLSRVHTDSLTTIRLSEPFSLCFAVRQGNSALLSILNRSIVGMDTGFAFNYVFNYIGSDEPGSLWEYILQHRVFILTVSVVVLCVILFVTLITTVKLNKSKRRLTEASNAKTNFLFNMSHDIRTPMNAILGFTDIALGSLDDREKLTDSLIKTREAGSILLSLINNILEMSRIEAGKAEPDEVAGDVRLSFESIRSTVQSLADEKDIDLTFEMGSIEDPYVYADFGRCLRVFINIITNSIKYTQHGGLIRVRCEQDGRDAEGRGIYRYTFEDNGIGMSEEFQKHLFDVFARENNSTASGIQGSGLGLSVVKSFVELLNGTIDCQSRQGEGTLFTVVFPFRLQPDEQAAQYINPETGRSEYVHAAEDARETPDFSGKRVLLVEDNELNREIAHFLLEEASLLVEDADDGTTAVEKLKEKGPDYYDFVLMDIQMPIMNGYEATRAIREIYPEASLPIIALSANAFAEDKAASLAAGMNDHIAKPINTDELFGALSKHLRA